MNGIFVALTISATILADATEKPQWISDYGVAIQAAKSAQQPLLVVLDKPNEPGQRFEQASYTSDKTQLALLSNYKLCRVDVTTPYGRKVAEAFEATQFPYTVITDKTCTKIRYSKVGHLGTEEWITTLAEYKSGQRSKQFVSRRSSLWNGERSGRICFT